MLQPEDMTSDCNKGDNEREKLNLDTILVEEIGQFGWFQIRSLVLALVVVIFVGLQGEYAFTTARIQSRCLIPECEDAESAKFAQDWILNAIPGTDSSSFDNCKRYDNVSYSSNLNKTGPICPADWFDTNTLVDCEDFVYENKKTVVYDFDLACDEWRRALIGFVRSSGTVLSLPITGNISDRFGRRFALALNGIIAALIGISRFWSNSYFQFTASEALESVFTGGTYSCIYILVLELVGPKYRVLASGIMSTFISLGQIALGLIAWAVNDWRPLTLTLYIPQLVMITYFWIMTESVRWYMSKGRYAESEAVLKQVAKVNGKHLSETSLKALRLTAEEETKKKKETENTNEEWLILQVIRNKQILIRCMVSPVWWVTMTFIYYGMTINSVNLAGNSYLNYVVVSGAAIPGYWISALLLARIGRRPVMIGGYWICAACQVAYIFIPDNLPKLSLLAYLIGKTSISSVVTSLYIYTAELYPTKYRHRLFAFSSMVGRLGLIVAPIVPAIGASTFESFPFVLFAGFAFFSGLFVFFTPETLGSTLPDTMEEATNIANGRINKLKSRGD